MAVYKNLQDYRKGLQAKIKSMKANKIKTPMQGAALMVLIAKSKAGRWSGETISNIRKRKVKEGWGVESWVSGGFKQNLWMNSTAPFAAPRMWWNNKLPTVYGDGTHRATGEPRFFDKAFIETKKQYDKYVAKNTEKTLRGTFQ